MSRSGQSHGSDSFDAAFATKTLRMFGGGEEAKKFEQSKQNRAEHRRRQLSRVFHAFDADRSGQLDPDELINVVSAEHEVGKKHAAERNWKGEESELIKFAKKAKGHKGKRNVKISEQGFVVGMEAVMPYDPEHFACTIKDWLALAPRMAPKTSPELSGNKIDHGSGATAWQLESASPAHGSSGAVRSPEIGEQPAMTLVGQPDAEFDADVAARLNYRKGELERVFRAYDVDKGGTIDAAEFTAVLEAQKTVRTKHAEERGWRLELPAVVKNAARAVKSGSGQNMVISMDEFVNQMEPCMPYDPESFAETIEAWLAEAPGKKPLGPTVGSPVTEQLVDKYWNMSSSPQAATSGTSPARPSGPNMKALLDRQMGVHKVGYLPSPKRSPSPKPRSSQSPTRTFVSPRSGASDGEVHRSKRDCQESEKQKAALQARLIELELILQSEAIQAGTLKNLRAEITQLQDALDEALGWQLRYTQLELLHGHCGESERAELAELRRQLRAEQTARRVAEDEAKRNSDKNKMLEVCNGELRDEISKLKALLRDQPVRVETRVVQSPPQQDPRLLDRISKLERELELLNKEHRHLKQRNEQLNQEHAQCAARIEEAKQGRLRFETKVVTRDKVVQDPSLLSKIQELEARLREETQRVRALKQIEDEHRSCDRTLRGLNQELKAGEQRVTSLQDNVKSLEGDNATLRKQLELAQRQLELVEKDHAVCAGLKKQLQDARQELERLRRGDSSTEADLKKQLRAALDQIDGLNQELQRRDAAISELERRLRAAEKEIGKLEKDHSGCESTREGLQGEIDRLQEVIERLLRQAGSNQGPSICADCTRWRSKYEDGVVTVSQLTSELQELQKTHDSCLSEDEIRRMRNELALLRSRGAGSEHSMMGLAAELRGAGSEHSMMGLAAELQAAVFILDPTGRILFSSAGGQIFLGRAETRDLPSAMVKGGIEVEEAIQLALEFDEITAGISCENNEGVRVSLNVWKTPTGTIEVLEDVESSLVGKHRWVQEDPHHHGKWHAVSKKTSKMLEDTIGYGESTCHSTDGSLMYSPHTRLAIEVGSGKNHKMKRQRRLRGWEAIPSSMDKTYDEKSPKHSKNSKPVNQNKSSFAKGKGIGSVDPTKGAKPRTTASKTPKSRR